MEKSPLIVMRIVFAACLFLSIIKPLQAQTENTVYTFTGKLDGGHPQGGVISDSNGHLYGVGQYGGKGTEQCAPHCGVLFELIQKPNGTWSEKTRHYFNSTPSDGFTPTAGLFRDNGSGNIYGTTSEGGKSHAGTIFELTSAGKYKILYSFKGGKTDGSAPNSALVLDSQGNLYGTTFAGGSTYGSLCGGLAGCGIVFEFQMSTHKEMVLHNFSNSGTDGYNPGGLLFADGALYGVTSQGGSANAGIAFEISPAPNGAYEIGYNFGSPNDAAAPSSALIKIGENFYGTSATGGTGGNGGTIFELSPNPGGTWPEQLVLSFYSAIGTGPYSGVAFDSQGNLYAAAYWNGDNGINGGTVIEVPLDGIPRTLWTFEGGSNGCHPNSPLIFDATGHLYGTTDPCRGDNGVVYEVTP